MDRDIIIILSDVDITYIILNGQEIGTGIERGYEVGEVIVELFEKLEHSYNKPIVKDIYIEDYWSIGEQEALWERDWKNDRPLFTQEEIQILYNTESIDDFMEKVKTDIRVRANEIDKAIQEM